MTVLIGFTGKAGSGKDTAANFLKQHYNFKSVAFADPIRAGMRAIMGLEDKHFQHPDKEVVLPEFGKSPRQMMQTFGTEWARETVNKDFWLILAGKAVAQHQANGYNVAITDIRFENEAEWLRSQGGILVHVVRPNASTTPHVHASESGVEMKPEDWMIVNDATYEELYARVQNMFYTVSNK